MTKLIGEELLSKLKEIEDLGKSDQARACGYVEVLEDGSQRINFMDFYAAVSDARSPGAGDISESDGENQIDALPAEWRALTEEHRIKRLTSEKVDTEILSIFSRIDEYKYAVALSENTPVHILDQLQEEGDYFVSQALIMRCLPFEIRCLDESDICALIQLGSIQDAALAKLSAANSWDIKEAVASAPNASNSTLIIVLADKDPRIQEIAARKLISDDLRELSSEELAKRIVGGKIENELVDIVLKGGDWKVRFAAHLASEGEHTDLLLDTEQGFAYRCFDALNRDGDLILGDDQKLIILRSGSAGDEEYTITLEKVMLDEDGDPEDYEQISYYESSLDAVASAIRDYLENDGKIEDIENSLPS
jgi:hypothetical protein